MLASFKKIRTHSSHVSRTQPGVPPAVAALIISKEKTNPALIGKQASKLVLLLFSLSSLLSPDFFYYFNSLCSLTYD